MKNSLKQLLRTPMKALLFFLLLTAGTALLTVGVCLFVQTSERIAKVENEFTTIATVEQKPVSTYVEEGYNDCLGAYGNGLPVYEKIIPFEVLDFPDAGYIGEPENRPVYMTSWLGLGALDNRNIVHQEYIAVFTPLEDSDGSGPVSAEVLRVHFSDVVFQDILPPPPDNLQIGDVIPVCQHFSPIPMKLEKGKVYLASLVWQSCSRHSDEFFDGEFVVYQQPYSTQYSKAGLLLTGDNVPSTPHLSQEGEVEVLHSGPTQNFPSFHDPNLGLIELAIDPEDPSDQMLPDESGWFDWINCTRLQYRLTPVVPTNDLELLPSFHSGTAKIARGRAITEEEFETGAKVCLIPDYIAYYLPQLYFVGKEISLPLYCSLYNFETGNQNYSTISSYRTTNFQRRYSLLNVEGSAYSPFSNDTYTVIGTYSMEMDYQASGDAELMLDCVVIPAKSVTASDENNIAYYGPMNAKTTSFRIPNGTIEEFDKKLHEAVPKAAELDITYYDNGYTKIMGDLNRARSTAALLLFAGAGATVSVIVLLLYFFVVKQKKRTAVERSLGMTKRQCRVSLLSGLLILALLAVCAGTALGGVALLDNESGKAEESTFITDLSDWKDVTVQVEGETTVPPMLFLVVPASVWLLTLVLGLLLLQQSLRIDPIYLLSGKIE